MFIEFLKRTGKDSREFETLVGANLYGANLRSANLRSANLSGADLSGADLSGASLRSANLPAPTIVLLANWGTVSEQLTADLMLFDSSAHPNPKAFQIWADGGECPYSNAGVQRVANFSENKHLWGKGKPCSIYNLMTRLLEEKTKHD